MSDETFDVELANAIRIAATGDAKNLARWIAKGKPPNAAEKEMLDELAAGEIKRDQGHPPMPKVSNNDQIAAVLDYRRRKNSKQPESVAAADVASAYKVSRSLLREWNKEFREVENRMREMGLANWKLGDWNLTNRRLVKLKFAKRNMPTDD